MRLPVAYDIDHAYMQGRLHDSQLKLQQPIQEMDLEGVEQGAAGSEQVQAQIDPRLERETANPAGALAAGS